LPLIEAQAGERLRWHPAAPIFAASPTDPQLFEQAWQRGMLWVIAHEHALAQGRARAHRRAVLTTLSDVAWNAPFYASEGFREWPAQEWSAGMREVMAAEAAAGFPMELRLAMQRTLD